METLHPGIFVQEIPGNPPIEGVSTATAAFVGVAIKGRIDESVLCTNWNEFVAEYGSFTANGYLAYAVRNFFENGGTRCYCNRVVHRTDGTIIAEKSTENLVSSAATPTDLATVNAINEGVWGDSLSIVVSNYNATNKTFDLAVLDSANQVELFEDINLTDIESYINGYSKYITVTLLSSTPSTDVIATQTITLTGGDNGLTGIADADYVGSSADSTGLYAFDNDSINIVAVPGIATSTVHQAIVTYTEGRKDCFGILDCPTAKTPTTMNTYKTTDAQLATENSAIYYPWIYVSDPIGIGKSPKKMIPPSGGIAGIYSRIDNSRGVSKAPAGTEAVILGALDVERKLTNAEQDVLNPNMINCIMSKIGNGICVWGARTLKKGDYTYIPVKRTNIFIESSLKNNLQWVVFEPNDARLWKRIKTVCTDFLTDMQTNGDIVNFYVVCDSTINTPSVVDAGKLYVDIGVANQKPAEFVIFRLSLI